MRHGFLYWLTHVGAIVLIVVMGLTVWALDKSRERTACYKAAKAVSDCEQPGAVERVVRWALARDVQ